MIQNQHYNPKIQLKRRLKISQRDSETNQINRRNSEFSKLVEEITLSGGLFNCSKSSIKHFNDLRSRIQRDKLLLLSQANLDEGMGYLFMELDNLYFRASEIVKQYNRAKIKNFLLYGFPQVFRRNVNTFLVSSLLFFIPFCFSMILTVEYTDQMHSIFGSMWKEPPEISPNLQAIISALIIQNNVNVGLLMFVMGFLFGIVAAFLLIYNGLAIGYAVGYVLVSGRINGLELAAYLLPHGFIEIPVIIIAGAAGLKLGKATGYLVFGKLNRAHELAREALYLFGGVFLLFISGIIEGYLSFTSRLSDPIGIILRIVFSFFVLFSFCWYLMRKEEVKQKIDLQKKEDIPICEVELYPNEAISDWYYCDFHWSQNDQKSYVYHGKVYTSNYRLILLPVGSESYFEIFYPFIERIDYFKNTIELVMLKETENLTINVVSHNYLSNVRYIGSYFYNALSAYVHKYEDAAFEACHSECRAYQEKVTSILKKIQSMTSDDNLKTKLHDEFESVRDNISYLTSLLAVT